MSHRLMDLLCWLWKCGARKDHRDGGHIGHDCMIGCYGVYYGMSYDRAVVWLCCRRTCNRTPIASIIDSMCINLYGNWYSVPWNSIRMICSWACVRCAAARDLCEFIFDTAVTPMEVTVHSIHFPLLCFIHSLCVYMFCSYSAGSVGKMRVGEIVIQCYYRAIKFRIFYP